MGPGPAVGRAAGQPDRQHVRSDRQQLEGARQPRLRHQPAADQPRHGVAGPLHQSRPEQDLRPGLGQPARDRRHPRRRRVVPGDQLQRRHRVARQSRPRLRRGLARFRLGRHAEPDVVGRQAHDEVRRRARPQRRRPVLQRRPRRHVHFSNFTTSQPNSPSFGAWGNSFASFLLGDVSSTTAVIPVDTRLRAQPLRAVRPGRVARDAGADAVVRAALGLPAAVPRGRRPDQHVPARYRQSGARPACPARWRSPRPTWTRTATASRTPGTVASARGSASATR